jgi:putative ABC transport system permease protein
MKASNILFRLSIRSIRRHMLRSTLSALGILIGVIAISAMGMLGANMTMVVTKQISSMGNTMVIMPDMGGGGMPGMPGGSSSSSSSSKDYISETSFKQINQIAGKYGTVYPVYQENSETIYTGADKEGRTSIYGLRTEDMSSVLTIQNGSFPRSMSDVVVGPNLAERNSLKIGSKITIGAEDSDQTQVRVVGILASRGLSSDLRTDSSIIATDTWFTTFYGGEGEYDQVTVLLDNVNDSTVLKQAILDQLNKKKDTVRVMDSGNQASTITSTITTLTTFIMAIAAISLVVAAVSIFNVMMMSVTERIHEIGIQRSIGTQKEEIMRMFLYEASAIGIIGSTIGAVASFGIGYLIVFGMIGTTEFFFTAPSLVYLPFGVGIGIAICVVSGLYPAYSAAKLDPVDALRAE